MTVEELRRILADAPDDAIVVCNVGAGGGSERDVFAVIHGADTRLGCQTQDETTFIPRKGGVSLALELTHEAQ